MKKRIFIAVIVMLIAVIFVSCGENTDSEYVTMLYRAAFEYPKNEAPEAVRFGNTVKIDDGYRFAYSYVSEPTEEREYDAGIIIFELDSNGKPIREQRLTEHGTSSADMLYLGERGLYVIGLCNDTENGKSYRGLFRYSYDGTREASAELKSLVSAADSPTDSRFILEYDGGVALISGKECVFANDALEVVSSFTLDGKANAAFFDDGELWVEYSKDGDMFLSSFGEDGTPIKSYVLSEAFCSLPPDYSPAVILEIKDGYLYARNSNEVFRWRIPDETDGTEKTDGEVLYDTVMDFTDSGIAGELVRSMTLIFQNDLPEFMLAERESVSSLKCVWRLYRPDPNADISSIEALTIACVSPTVEMTKAVVDFNKGRTDIRIDIADYSMYNTADDRNAGRDRLILDLTTGVLKPDILFLDTGTYSELCESADGYFLNLYTLMDMDGEVTRDTICGCVKNTLEAENGELYCISTDFTLSTLVGRRDTIGDNTKWSLSEFLDFANGLSDGEYLMEEVSGTNAESELFGSLVYAPFMRDGKADFENEEFLRLLEFLSSLPAEPELYMEHGTSNAEDLLAGEISEDEVYVTAGGEDLYHSGKIKLDRFIGIGTARDILNAVYTFGVYSPAELNFIGYPVDFMSDSGVAVKMTGGVYSIPSCTSNAGAAWDFIEECMLFDVFDPTDEVAYLKYGFKTYKPYTDAYLDKLEGYGILHLRDIGTLEGRELSSERGTVCAFDSAAISEIKRLFEESGIPLYYAIDAGNIIKEETDRYLAGYATASDCARVINSRVGIRLSERGR